MTLDEMLALPAGRELDALVAERVFGIGPREVRARGSTNTVVVYSDSPALSDGVWTEEELQGYGQPPPYSTEMAASWLALERVACRKHWTFTIASEDGCGAGPLYYVTIRHGGRAWEAHSGYGDCEDSLPAAVCRAALLAVGG